MRTFIAIEIPDVIKDELVTVCERLQQSETAATWVKREAMHLTLQFLGEIEQDALRVVAETLRTTYAGMASAVLRIRQLGAFPNLRKPSVIWIGVEPLDGPLDALHRVAESGAAAIGIKPESRPFRPHVTLARIRHPSDIRKLCAAIEREGHFDAGAFRASAVSLFSSELTRQGPVYRRLEEFPLQ